MMETAQDFIDRYFDGRLKLSGELANMLSDRDAKIRKECADRGVAWFKKIFGVTEERLRAAIMGDTHE